jgi:putative glycosyltransferase (TIGR04372 family)
MKYILKAVHFLQIIIYSPIILFIVIIWPLLRIRIGVIKSRSFGHIAMPEIYLCDKKFGLYKKNEIVLWYHFKQIANKYLLKKRKEQLIFLPGILLHPIREFFYEIKFFHKHIYYKVDYDHEGKKKMICDKSRTNQEFLKKSESSIKFSHDEIVKGDDYLEKNFINNNDKIVLFASRSPLYRDENFISIRNSSIKTQVKAIKFVTENGYKAIRVGRDKIDQFNIDTKKFFDYTFAEHQSDFLDIYISSKAKFMVWGTTGLNELTTVMRIPELLVDFTLFNILSDRINEAYNPIILPKKIYSKALGRHLSYKEIFEKKLFDVQIISEIPNDFQLIDNSEDEILEATKEMIELAEHKLDLNDERIKQNNFWNLQAKFYGVKEKMIISPNFFKKNNKLFI